LGAVTLTIHSLDSAGLELFQSGKMPESEQGWDRLVPPQALEALGKKEVERQSVLFEIFKSELDYVNDLQTIEDVRCINHSHRYD
jgi:hypothetical protein